MSAAYRVAAPLPAEDDIRTEAKLMARRVRLIQRKQLADAWVGSPESDRFRLRPATVVGTGGCSWGIAYLVWHHHLVWWVIGFAFAMATLLASVRVAAHAFQRVAARALTRAERELAALQSK